MRARPAQHKARKITVIALSPPYSKPYEMDEDAMDAGEDEIPVKKTEGTRALGLNALSPVLKEWIQLNKLLADRWKDVDDVPWWYGERASVSLFAGAIWNKGKKKTDYAFEEYGGVKKNEGKDFSGRVDLEFSFGGQLFIAEAKQCWLESPHKQDYASRVRKALARARDDVLCCDPHGMRRLAIVFGVPHFKDRSGLVLSAHVSGFIREAMSIEADAVAWVFPTLAQRPKVKGHLYPGVAVWIQEVK